MALSITRDTELVAAPALITVALVDFDASYPTGGEVLGKDALGVRGKVIDVMIMPRLGYIFEYDKANDKIKVFVETDTIATALTEVANAVDLSALLQVKVTIFHYHT